MGKARGLGEKRVLWVIGYIYNPLYTGVIYPMTQRSISLGNLVWVIAK